MTALQSRLLRFRQERQWDASHTPANLARAVAVEAGELNELFLWDRTPAPHRVAEEVADVMIFALNLCNAMGFDAEAIITLKIAANERRRVNGDRLEK